MKIFTSKRTGWSANALFVILVFAVVFIIMASFMPSLTESIGEGVGLVESSDNGILLALIYYAVPILLVLMGLFGIIVAMVNR